MTSNSWLDRQSRRMNKARRLLRPGVEAASGVWADLGCGEGIFTAVLHTMLEPGSQIYAVDKNRRALQTLLRNFDENYPEASVQPILADFTHPLVLPPLDGLVMANSLHFVRQKRPVLAPLVRLLKPGGRLIVVEYNTNRGNYAVPYPLAEAEFLTLARQAGLQQARILTRVPSTFLGEMYTGIGLAVTAPRGPAGPTGR